MNTDQVPEQWRLQDLIPGEEAGLESFLAQIETRLAEFEAGRARLSENLPVEEFLLEAGMDITSPDFWQGDYRVLEGRLARLEHIVGGTL